MSGAPGTLYLMGLQSGPQGYLLGLKSGTPGTGSTHTTVYLVYRVGLQVQYTLLILYLVYRIGSRYTLLTWSTELALGTLYLLGLYVEWGL